MERKIGEIFEYEGEWYQCINTGNCSECAFTGKRCYDFSTKGVDIIGDCTGRTFKKLEKVGEPYMDGGKIMQKYKRVYREPIYFPYKELNCYNDLHGRICIEIKQSKEDMEEKNNGNTPLNVLTDKYVNGDICYDDFEKEVKALYSCKEEIKPTLKDFDLEAAKQGKPVYTRDGRKARIVCYDFKGGDYPIIALVECRGNREIFCAYSEKGEIGIGTKTDEDLMIAPELHEGWVNIVKEELSDDRVVLGRIFDSYEDAFMSGKANERYIATVKIEWTE